MPPGSFSAQAHPNLALVKYWGNRDQALRLPSNGSISLTLGEFWTRTSVEWLPGLAGDTLVINGLPVDGQPLERVSRHLDLVRRIAQVRAGARVRSRSNFPASAGLASSASAFAALSLAACVSAGLTLSQIELTKLARRGSGSAARSIPGGFVELFSGDRDDQAFAASLAPPDHWRLQDIVAILGKDPKHTGSSEGHARAVTSPLQDRRVTSAPIRLDECRRAILERDFAHLAAVTELDSNLMHAVMATSQPPLVYLGEQSVHVMREVARWRAEGLPTCYSVDAGPNVHCLTEPGSAAEVTRRLQELPGVREIRQSGLGAQARLLEADELSSVI